MGQWVKMLDSLKLEENCNIKNKSLLFAWCDFFFFCIRGVAQQSLGSQPPSVMSQEYCWPHRVTFLLLRFYDESASLNKLQK